MLVRSRRYGPNDASNEYAVLDLDTPEEHFMKVLIKRKAEKLKKMDVSALQDRDVTLKVFMPSIYKKGTREPMIWRRFRCSSGLRLSAFQDKILAPIMGWVRNFHCHAFTDWRDGSMYGPENSHAIDRMHIAMTGFEHVPDNRWTLAHLFSAEGDAFEYLYDYGDHWYHEVQVEHIWSAEESTGGVQILGGEGACPGGKQLYIREFCLAKALQKT